VFVKICGLTTPAAVQAAIDNGADAVGFVFAESPRRTDPEVARSLCEPVPAGVMRVAVMRHPSAAEWETVRDVFGPDWLQTDAADLASLELGPKCAALPVYRNARPSDEQNWPSPMLFEGMASGSGRTADWERAAAIAAHANVILAGGLNSANVADAIAAVRPWGIDVSSGVESSPGTKDPKKIVEFIARARAAEKQ